MWPGVSPCGWRWGWQQVSGGSPDSRWVSSCRRTESWPLALKRLLSPPARGVERDSDGTAHLWNAQRHVHVSEQTRQRHRCVENDASHLSSVHSLTLLCVLCVGRGRRSLPLRWCCVIFSGESCSLREFSSRSYMSRCSSRAKRFSSRYCFSRTCTTFCMGSEHRNTSSSLWNTQLSACQVKGHERTVAPQSLHHDLHLSELIAVVLFRWSLAGRLHVHLHEALAGRVSLHLFQTLTPLAFGQVDPEGDTMTVMSVTMTTRVMVFTARVCYLKKWLFPHKIRSPCHRWTRE